jgi:hypothetical protein
VVDEMSSYDDYMVRARKAGKVGDEAFGAWRIERILERGRDPWTGDIVHLNVDVNMPEPIQKTVHKAVHKEVVNKSVNKPVSKADARKAYRKEWMQKRRAEAAERAISEEKT